MRIFCAWKPVKLHALSVHAGMDEEDSRMLQLLIDLNKGFNSSSLAMISSSIQPGQSPEESPNFDIVLFIDIAIGNFRFIWIKMAQNFFLLPRYRKQLIFVFILQSMSVSNCRGLMGHPVYNEAYFLELNSAKTQKEPCNSSLIALPLAATWYISFQRKIQRFNSKHVAHAVQIDLDEWARLNSLRWLLWVCAGVAFAGFNLVPAPLHSICSKDWGAFKKGWS